MNNYVDLNNNLQKNIILEAKKKLLDYFLLGSKSANIFTIHMQKWINLTNAELTYIHTSVETRTYMDIAIEFIR